MTEGNKIFCPVCKKETRLDKFGTCEECGLVPSEDVLTSKGAQQADDVPAETAAKEPEDAKKEFLPVIQVRLKEAGRITDIVWTLESGVIIGRTDPESGPVDIDLSNLRGSDYVSRHHAKIYPENGQWMVTDLNSTNGTFLGQERISEPRPLKDDDIIALGIIKMLVSFK